MKNKIYFLFFVLLFCKVSLSQESTPTPTPMPIAEPFVKSMSVIITDDRYSSIPLNLTSGVDVDAADQRELAIWWDWKWDSPVSPNREDVENFLIYIKYYKENKEDKIKKLFAIQKNEYPYMISWSPDNPAIEEEFRDGPEFGFYYKFSIYTDVNDQIGISTSGLYYVYYQEGVPPTPTPVATPVPTVSMKSITIDLPGLPEDAKKLEMIRIPAGTFIMGSPGNEDGRYVLYYDNSNKPYPPTIGQKSNDWTQHEVTISKDFYLAKYTITQAQWKALMGEIEGDWRYVLPEGNDYPEIVKWSQCRDYIDAINQLDQGVFRLPTEAEWEYACRAGTTTRYYFGEAAGDYGYANVNYELCNKYMWWSANTNASHDYQPVGLKWPNPWGLHDMCGNMWEWCEDAYYSGVYTREAQVDPWYKQDPSWDINYQNIRGGSTLYDWSLDETIDNARRCRSASRSSSDVKNYDRYYAIRLYREADDSSSVNDWPVQKHPE